MMSDGHSTARSLSLIECLNEWITHPSGTLGFSHLFIAAEAELVLLMKDKKLTGKYKGITKKLVSDAFPTLINASREGLDGASPASEVGEVKQ